METLDGRTTTAKQIKKLEQDLTEAPTKTTSTLLRASIARNSVIMSEIFKTVMDNTDGEFTDHKGKLSPKLKSFNAYQSANHKMLLTLMKLTEGGAAGGGDEDLASIIESATAA